MQPYGAELAPAGANTHPVDPKCVVYMWHCDHAYFTDLICTAKDEWEGEWQFIDGMMLQPLKELLNAVAGQPVVVNRHQVAMAMRQW